MPESVVYNVDCLEYMRTLPDKAFELAIVDPPYGIGMGGSLNVNSKVKFTDKKWDTDVPTDEYFQQLDRISVNRIVWGANYFYQLWPVKEYVFWNKLNHHDNRSDGEIASTSFNGLPKYFEYMWDGNRYGIKGNIKGVGEPTVRIHPTEKPVALYKWLLKNYAKPGDRIFDSHMGSQSSRIAAYDMGFDFTGCELDKDYFDAGNKRFEQYKAQLKLF